MMATTHALVGLAVGSVAAALEPAHAPAALAAGLVGGTFPDLDLYAGHRKTLHFPAYYPAAAVPTAWLAVAAGHPVATAAAVFLAAAALHSAMDVLGGGLELRPWRGTSDRAVFDHRRGRWLAPRRWIRYDGAPEDLALAAGIGLPLATVLDGPWPVVVGAILAVSAAYVLLRKPLVRLADRLVGRLPLRVLRYVPERFLEGLEPAEPATGPAAD
ncbi:MAG: metal-dependent hydrolase [Halobacteriales archaeon]